MREWQQQDPAAAKAAQEILPPENTGLTGIEAEIFRTLDAKSRKVIRENGY